MPRVSIIVPAYNAAATLHRALASAQLQSVRDIEILVIDDASTDATAAVALACQQEDDRVVLRSLPENAGPGVARNVGIEVASGEWIALLDADDYFLPDRLERLLTLAAAHDADMVADNLFLCPEEPADEAAPALARLMPPAWMVSGTPLSATRYVAGNMGRGSQTRFGYGYLKPLIRRAFLRQHALTYDPARFAEDYLFYLRCLLAGAQWFVTPDAFYLYDVAPHSLTSTHSVADLWHLAAAEKSLAAEPRVAGFKGLYTQLIRHHRSVLRTLAWSELVAAIKRGQAGEAISALLRHPADWAYLGRMALGKIPAYWRYRTRPTPALPP